MTESDNSSTGYDSSDTERYCGDCDMVVYDIPIRDEDEIGYSSPHYCPKCGKPLHADWVKCNECGGVIDFKKAVSFAKTRNDEQFWHDDCAPEIQSVAPGTERDGDSA
jgi:predicted amidophosphoribosyltransferase